MNKAIIDLVPGDTFVMKGHVTPYVCESVTHWKGYPAKVTYTCGDARNTFTAPSLTTVEVI